MKNMKALILVMMLALAGIVSVGTQTGAQEKDKKETAHACCAKKPDCCKKDATCCKKDADCCKSEKGDCCKKDAACCKK